MSWALVAAVGILFLVVVFRPRQAAVVSVLVVVENREEEIEGVLRSLLAIGRDVVVLDRESHDTTVSIVVRLQREHPEIALVRGDFSRALGQCPGPQVLLLRLDGPYNAREVMKAL